MNSKLSDTTSEVFWEEFVDKLNEPILILDASGVITYANHAACLFFEKKSNQLQHSLFGFPVNHTDLTEIEIIDAHGHHRIAEMRTQSCHWTSGPASIVTLRDITKRKANEQNLRIAANVFNFAKEGIVITDTAGVIIDVNQEFTHITHYDKADVVGKSINILSSGKHEHAFYQSMWQHIKDKGYWYGEIWNKKKNGEIYPQLEAISEVKDEAGDVINYVGVFYDITQQEAQKKELEFIAYYDNLTKLPNRTLITHQIEKAIHHAERNGQHIAVVFIDLDDFKRVNDQYAHHIGDLILKKFSNITQKVIRETDVLGRYGGDEFILLLNHLEDKEQFYPLLIRIYDALQKPIIIESYTVKIGVSMGVTTYPQVEHKTSEQLIRQADQAMYKSKISGKSRISVFDLEFEQIQREETQHIKALQHALSNNQLKFFYQPKVDMCSNQIIGAEALMRWHHPEKGLLLPEHFLKNIKHDALLNQLTDWTIRSALEQLKHWHEHDIHLNLSINIDAFEFEQTHFFDHLLSYKEHYSSNIIKHLEFEILESSTISNMASVSRLVKQCKQLGIEFSLDDFGTGYSSINYLLALPFKYMKIDRHFIQNILNNTRDIKILKAMMDIANAVDIDVIAEGVETKAHQEFLISLGCRYGQGFVFSKPIPIEAFNDWLSTKRLKGN